MGGGVRAARHFTEMVGGDMHVTCGWNFIDEMNRTNPEILSRIDAMASPEELEELKEKFRPSDVPMKQMVWWPLTFLHIRPLSCFIMAS